MSGRAVSHAEQRTERPLWEYPVAADRFAVIRLAHQTEQWADAEQMARELLAEALAQVRGEAERRPASDRTGGQAGHAAAREAAARYDAVKARSGATLVLPANSFERSAPTVLHVVRVIADTIYMTNRLTDCLIYLEEAMREGVLPLDDSYAELLRGWIYRRNNQLNTAIVLAREQLRRGGEDMTLEIRASFLHLQADCELHSGRTLQAQRHLQDAVALSRASGSLEVQALALNALGMTERMFNRLPTARRLLEEALRLHERLGKPERQAQVLLNLAVLHTKCGQPQRALQLLDDSREVQNLVARPQRRMMIRLARAKALLEVDRVQEAQQETRPILGLSIKGRYPRVEVLALEVLGDCALAAGRFEQARRYFERGLEVCGPRVPGYQAAGADLACGLYRRLGQSYLLVEDFKQAVQLLRRALQLARSGSERYEEGIAGRLLASAYAHLDQHGRATEVCQQAVDVMRNMGAELQLAHCLKEAASIHFTQCQKEPEHRLEQALSLIVEAEQLYQKFGERRKVKACRELLNRIRAASVGPWSRKAPAGTGKIDESPLVFIARASVTRHLLSSVEVAAKGDDPVLITGETGTGKELIARLVHEQSSRREVPWVAVNCAAIPGTLFEREIFGHRAGAFTGAAQDRPGLCEQADGGTLFLDEVGEVDLPLQVKLLRLLQEGTYHRLGDPEERRVDLRIVAATNADLIDRIENGQFRRDLFYRLRMFDLQVPPLRKRRGDIRALIRHFVKQQLSDEARPEDLFEPAVLAALRSHTWPGNVRELEGVIKRMVMLAMHEGQATVAMLPPEIRRCWGGGDMSDVPCVERDLNLARHLEQAERSRIELALTQAGGNRTAAARLLGISRTTLYKKLQRLEIGMPAW